jgi:cold shock protein
LDLQLLPKVQVITLRFAEAAFFRCGFSSIAVDLLPSGVFWAGPRLRKGRASGGRPVVVSRFVFFEEVAVMPQGTIKKLIMDKGFGFIQGEKGELFFHHSALDGIAIEELREGQKVEFEEGRGPKGPRAENVKPVA